MINSFRFVSAGVSVTAFYRTASSGKLACSNTADNLRYHDGVGALPDIGDTLYTDNPGVFTDGLGNYGVSTTNAGSIFTSIGVDSGGVVTSTAPCL